MFLKRQEIEYKKSTGKLFFQVCLLSFFFQYEHLSYSDFFFFWVGDTSRKQWKFIRIRTKAARSPSSLLSFAWVLLGLLPREHSAMGMAAALLNCTGLDKTKFYIYISAVSSTTTSWWLANSSKGNPVCSTDWAFFCLQFLSVLNSWAKIKPAPTGTGQACVFF